jgi:hypothetical protein
MHRLQDGRPSSHFTCRFLQGVSAVDFGHDLGNLLACFTTRVDLGLSLPFLYWSLEEIECAAIKLGSSHALSRLSSCDYSTLRNREMLGRQAFITSSVEVYL